MSDWFKRVFLGIAVLGLLAAAPAQAQNGRGQDPVVPGEIIVGVRPGVAVDAVAAALDAISVRSLGGGGAFLLEVDDDPVNAAARARRLPGVGYADPNYIRSLYGPTDTDYGIKWDLHNVGSICSENDGTDCASPDADMDWEEAYSEYGNSIAGDAVIAVLDTGADLYHPDLSNKLILGFDYFDNDNDPTDDYGHGTHVAGIAAAVTNNATGTAGVAWLANVQVMPLKVCGWIQTLFGNVYGCPDDAIISAINHAINNGADVINMSLGGGSRSKAQENAVNDAWNAGLVIVASSGNDGSDSKVSYPAAYANAIAVGATDWNDVRAPYSNGGNALDVVAPGGRMVYYHDLGGIYSTMPTYGVTLTQAPYAYSNNYDQLQGTSMSAPQVAGLAALLFAQGHANTDVRALIESTADDLGAAEWDKLYGHGRINVDAALSGSPPPPPNDAPTVSITSPNDSSTFVSSANISFAGTAGDTEDGDLTASLVWTSDIDGQIGTGGSFSKVLSDGNHTITASVTDSGDKTGSFSVSITVGDPPVEATAVSVVDPITFGRHGGRFGTKHLLITVVLLDDLGNPVEGASVTLQVSGLKGGTGTGTTLADGTVAFSLKNAPVCSDPVTESYTATVTNVTAAGLTWNSSDPTNTNSDCM